VCIIVALFSYVYYCCFIFVCAAVAAIQMQQIGARILCTDETFRVAKYTENSVKAVATFMNEYGEYVNIRTVGETQHLTEENDGAQLLKFRNRLIRSREMETGEAAPSRTRDFVQHNISSDMSKPAYEKCAVDHIVTDNCCDKRNSILLKYFNPVSGYVGLDRYLSHSFFFLFIVQIIVHILHHHFIRMHALARVTKALKATASSALRKQFARNHAYAWIDTKHPLTLKDLELLKDYLKSMPKKNRPLLKTLDGREQELTDAKIDDKLTLKRVRDELPFEYKSLIRTFTWVSLNGLRQRIKHLESKKDGKRIFKKEIENMHRKIVDDDGKELETLEVKYDAFMKRWSSYNTMISKETHIASDNLRRHIVKGCLDRPPHMKDTDIFTPIERIRFTSKNGSEGVISRYRSVMCTSNLESKHKYLPTAVSGQSSKDMWAFRLMQHCGDVNSRIRIQRTRFLYDLVQLEKVNKLKLRSKDKRGELRRHWDVPFDQVESIADKRRSGRVSADPSFSPHFKWCEQHRYAISDAPIAMWMRKLAQKRKLNPDLFIPIDAVQQISLDSTRKSPQQSRISDNGERFLISHVDGFDDENLSASQSFGSAVIPDDISSYFNGTRSISHSLLQSELQKTKKRSKTITTTTTKSNKRSASSIDMEDLRQNKRVKSIRKGKQNNARSRSVGKQLHKAMFRSKPYVTQQQAQFIIDNLQPFCLDLYGSKNTKKMSGKQIEALISTKIHDVSRMCNNKMGMEQGFESPVDAKYLEDWWNNRCTHKSLDQISSQQDLIQLSQKILRDLKATDSQQPSHIDACVIS
jgi:hypothetical protein